MYNQDMSGESLPNLRRNQIENIERLLESFPIVLILGVRQCGKSTLSRMVRPEWKYFDLENGRDYDYINADPDFFFRENNSGLIIDEAQESPQIFKQLRGIVDSEPERKNRFILTGSSSPDLIANASDSLAGRIGMVELEPMKMNELLSNPLPDFYSLFLKEIEFNGIDKLKDLKQPETKPDVIDFFHRGGYPAPVLRNDPVYQDDWMENYFQTYVNRDIRRLFPKLNGVKYRRFISMLSELSGTIINKAQVGRSLDINEVTVRDYLEIAHKTFIWRLIPSYEKTKSKSITKMPKGILRDSGLTHYLSSIDTRDKLLRSPNFGQNFESFVIEEIIRGLHALPVHSWNYYYFRTKNGMEIDLILEGLFGIVPIEIKSGSSTSIKKVPSLKRFVDELALPLGIVVNNDDEVKMLSERIIQIPAAYI